MKGKCFFCLALALVVIVFFYPAFFFRNNGFICQVYAIFFSSVDVKIWEVWPVFHHSSPCKIQHNVVWMDFIIWLVFQPIFIAVPIRKWSFYRVELFMFTLVTLFADDTRHVVFWWQFCGFLCTSTKKWAWQVQHKSDYGPYRRFREMTGEPLFRGALWVIFPHSKVENHWQIFPKIQHLFEERLPTMQRAQAHQLYPR